MALKEDVKIHVVNYLYSFTAIHSDKIIRDYFFNELTQDPFSLDNPALNALTLTLRGYIQNLKQGLTLMASEVKTQGLTVSGLIDLVYSKVK